MIRCRACSASWCLGGSAETQWQALARAAEEDVEAAVSRALARPTPDAGSLTRHAFCEHDPSGSPLLQQQGGAAPEGHVMPRGRGQVIPRGRASTCSLQSAARSMWNWARTLAWWCLVRM